MEQNKKVILSTPKKSSSSEGGRLKFLDEIKTPEDLKIAVVFLRESQPDFGTSFFITNAKRHKNDK